MVLTEPVGSAAAVERHLHHRDDSLVIQLRHQTHSAAESEPQILPRGLLLYDTFTEIQRESTTAVETTRKQKKERKKHKEGEKPKAQCCG